MTLLLVLVVLLVCVERSECVQCFAHFNLTSGCCSEELGDVAEDDCCQNPRYGYKTPDGACQSCGPPVWSSWSPWSQCSSLCGKGVRQRTRTCYGVGACDDPANTLQLEPCGGVCCDDRGWGSWLAWSPCSLTCGGGGVRTRQRNCSSPPECRSACRDPSEETESCPPQRTCPVHGGWSGWSGWTPCSGPCIDEQNGDTPSRQRRRSCAAPPPSADTAPPGDMCPGDEVQEASCSELPNCPVDGSWSPWSRPGPCSSSCGQGLQMSTRTCSSPAPKYGGRFCDGPSAQTSVCQAACPVDGSWSGWSAWSECSASCLSENNVPTRTRQRSCSNPAPSPDPPGRPCPGYDGETDRCDHLPRCPVDGGWTSWSAFTRCAVTCGVGLQVSDRSCSSPAADHGGRPCPGDTRRTKVCTTSVHCPVDGLWSEWTSWNTCVYPFRKSLDIRCQKIGGSQTRERQCLHQAFNGSICSGENLTERRLCYDVTNCHVMGTWQGWNQWSLCRPLCGKSRRARLRFCKPDYTGYNRNIGRSKENVTFFGTPNADCGDPPKGEQKYELEDCLGLPECT